MTDTQAINITNGGTINLPSTGAESATYTLPENGQVSFGFDISDAVFNANDHNLIISIEGQGSVIIENYQNMAQEGSAPTFTLIGGEQVPGNVYLFLFNDGGDNLETATGGGDHSGGGINAYTDDSGTLFRSLDSVGGQSDPNRGASTDGFSPTQSSSTEGTNANPPSITGELNITMEEDGTYIIYDTDILSLVTDPDPGTFAGVTSLTISGGTLTEVRDGAGNLLHWAFEPDADFNGSLDINFTVSDGVFTANGTGSVTVTAVNDAPVVDADTTGAVNEDALISGTVADDVTDIDTAADALTYTLADGQASVEGLTFNADGSYSFDASAYDYLSEGQPETFTINYTVSDGDLSDNGQLVITVTGTNDAPVVETSTADAVDEDNAITGTVADDVSDADTAASALVYTLADGQTSVEGLTFNADGSYSFDASSYDYLSEGVPETITINYTVSDGDLSDNGQLIITVTGTNDAPVVEARTVDAVNEDAVTTGTVADDVSDVDTNASALTYTLAAGQTDVEGLTFNADGSYTFDASSYDSLREGQDQIIRVNYTVSDGDLSDNGQLVITVTGTNDAPEVNAISTDAGLEDTRIRGTVADEVSDVDTGARQLVYALADDQDSVEGLTFRPNGSYVLNTNSYDYLADGVSETITIDYTVFDGFETVPGQLEITVTGTNDAPVVEARTVDAVNEDAVTTGTVADDVSDVDTDASALTYTLAAGQADVEGLTFNADGSYTFDASSYDSLREGQDQVIRVNYTVSDGDLSDNGQLVITVTGTNDAPEVNAISTDAGLEDTRIRGTVADEVTDVDTGARQLVYALADDQDSVDGLTFRPNGSYVLNTNSYDYLADGVSETITIDYTVFDGFETVPGQLEITVTGTNDAPVVEARTVDAVNEDAVTTGTVADDVSDVDTAAAALTYTLAAGQADVEGLTFNADGSYTFDASSYDSLKEGQDQVIRVNYTVSDGDLSDNGQLVITVTGTNDAPVVNEISTDAGLEDTRIRGTVADEVTDVDTGARQLVYALADDQDSVDGLTFRPNGSYVLNTNSYDYLADGVSETITIDYTVFDGFETVPGQLEITVTGTNDAPVVEARTVDAVNEDAVTTGTVADDVSDVDTDASALTYTLAAGQADVEGLTFNADGSYTFDASSYDSLREGQDQVIRVNYTVSDGDLSDNGQLVITVTGTNDAPEVNAISTDAGLEDTRIRGTVADEVTDVDTGARQLVYALADDQDSVDGLTFRPNGSYVLNTNSYDYLADGVSETITIDYTVFDGFETVPGQLEITVTGTNDAPVVEARTVDAVNEDAVTTGTVADDVSDVDTAASALTYTLAAGQADVEGLTFNADGSYTFDASSYDSLREGQDQVIRVNYTASDGDLTDNGQLVITVTGTNDAPTTGTPYVVDATEDTPVTFTMDDVLENAGDIDSDLDDLTVTSLTLDDESQGELVYNETTETWTFTPAADFNGNVEYSFTVSDGIDSSIPGSGTIAVGEVNDPPTLDFSGVEASTDFIVNGSFEDVPIAEGGWAEGHVPDGWDLVDGTRWEVMSGERFGIEGASDGNNVVDFGVGGEALVISQDVTNLSAGEYVIQLDLFDRGSNLNETDSGAINVYWNNELVGSFNPGDEAWETGTVVVTVDEGETSGELKLESSNNDSYGNVVDNVTMYAITDNDDAISVVENAGSGTYIATAAGADVETATEDLRYTIEDNPNFVIDEISGVITVAENANINYEALGDDKSITINVTVTDEDGLSTTKPLEIGVADVNEGPVLADDTVGNVDEDNSTLITTAQLLGDSTDPEGNPLSIDDLTVTEGEGTLTDNGDGTWTFEPSDNWNGTVELNYNISDGVNSTAQTADFEVNPVDDASTLSFATASGSEDLITNGSFEYIVMDGSTDNVPIADGGWAQGGTPDGWTLVEGDRWEAMSGVRHGIIGASDGNNVIDTGVGNNEALVISQNINGLSEGQYVLELDMFDRGDKLGGADSGNIDVYWNGELVATFNPDDVNWETGTVVVNVDAGETSGELILASHNNDSYANVIDNITMHSIGDEMASVALDEDVSTGTFVAQAVGSDIDSTDLSFSLVDPNSPFAIDPDTGVITVAAGLDYETDTNYTIEVKVTNGDGGEVTQSLDVVVNNLDDNPAEFDGPLTANVNEGGEFTLTSAMLGYHDADGGDDSFTIRLTGQPAGGELVRYDEDGNEVGTIGRYESITSEDIDAGLIRFNHTTGEEASDAFSFQIKGETGGWSGRTAFDVTVNNVNDAPTLDLNAEMPTVVTDVSVYSGASYDNLVGAYVIDEDGNPSSPVLIVTGSKDVLSDSDGATGMDELQNTVFAPGQDVQFFIIPNGNGALADDTNYDNVSFDTSGGTVRVTVDGHTFDRAYFSDPDLNVDGTDHFRETINDDGTITIGIEDLYAGGDRNYTDVELTIRPGSDGSTGHETSFTEGGSAVSIAGNVAITDADSVTMSQVTITLNVANAADTLSVDTEGLAALDGIAINEGLSGLSEDGTTYTIVLEGSASGTAYEQAIKLVSFENDSDAPGGADRTVDVTVYDDLGAPSGTATTTIDMVEINDAPIGVDDSSQTVAEDGMVTIDVLANDTDVDSADLTITSVGQNFNETTQTGQVFNANNVLIGTATIVNGKIEFSPAENYNGPATFDYTVSDGSLSDTASVSVNVTAVNDAPIGVDDPNQTVAEDGMVTIDVLDNDTDVDSADLTITSVGQNFNETTQTGQVFDANNVLIGTATIVNGKIEFSPAENYNGPATFDYTVSDGSLSDTASVSVNVTAVNDAPIGVDDPSQTVAEDGMVTIDVLDNDTDVDNADLSITSVGQNFNATTQTGQVFDTNNILIGTATIVDGKIEFSPAENYNGPATFDYTVSDGSLSDTASVSVNVIPVNDAFTSDDVTLHDIYEDGQGGDGSITFSAADLRSNANDPDGDILTVDNVTLAEGDGTLVDHGNGTWTFNPDTNWNGDVSFDYTLTDGEFTTNQSASLNVVPTDDASILTFAAGIGEDLILNGSFEDVDVRDNGWSKEAPEQWGIEEGAHWVIMDENYNGVEGASDGENVLDLALANGPLVVSQEVNGLTAGEYVLELDMFDRGSNIDGEDSAPVSVYWRGELIASFNPGDVDWETGTATITVPDGVTSGKLMLVTSDDDTYGNIVDNITLRSVDTVETNTVEINEGVANGSLVATAIGTDIDSTDLSFSIKDEDSPFTIDSETGEITVKDSDALQGLEAYDVDVTVTDINGNETTETLTVEVNEPPVGTDFIASASAPGEAIAIDFTEDVNVSDADGDVTAVTITDTPEASVGTLYYNGVAVEQGETYSLADGDFTFEATPDAQSSLLLGSKDGGDLGLTNWGASSDSVNTNTLTQDVNGTTITVQSNLGVLTGNETDGYNFVYDLNQQGNTLEQYDNEQGHIGTGIGTTEGQGIESGNSITVDFGDNLVTSATVGFDGMGGYFNPDSMDAKAVWIAMRDGEPVGSGAIQPDGNTIYSELTITSDMTDGNEFDSIVFTTEGTGNWDLRYVEADFDMDPSFNYIPVDDDNLAAGEESTVTLDISSTIAIDTEAPELDLGGKDITFVSQNAGYTNMLGVYFVEDGEPSNPEIILADSKDAGMLENVLKTFDEDAEVHFFLVSDAGGKGLTDTDAQADLNFVMHEGNWALAMGDTIVDIQFDLPQFNPNGEEDTFRINTEDGTVLVEVDDQINGVDNDFNDLVAKVSDSDNYGTTWTEDEGPVSIAGDVNISDDSDQLSGATIILTNAQTGDLLSVGDLPDGMTVEVTKTNGTITVTLSGDLAASAYEEAIQAVTFQNIGDPGEIDRIVQIEVTDQSDNTSATATSTISVAPPAEFEFGDDAYIGNDSDEILLGGNHSDAIAGAGGNDIIVGNNGDDTLAGQDGNDGLYGGRGDDLILGGNGNDNMTGYNGDDSMEGGDGNDAIYGEKGDDTLLGGDGNDLLVGGKGDDFIFGGAGYDTIEGDSGDDYINPGSGGALITTGEGNDTIFIDQSALAEGNSEIIVKDFELGSDALELGDGMSVKDIMSGTEDSISYTQVLVGDEHNNNVVVKLLGVTQTALEHQSDVTPDASADDLIQYMIDSASD